MKNFILLFSIFIFLNFYGQLTLSSIEFLNNQRDITFTNHVNNTSETRKVSSGIYFYRINLDENGNNFVMTEENDGCKIIYISHVYNNHYLLYKNNNNLIQGI